MNQYDDVQASRYILETLRITDRFEAHPSLTVEMITNEAKSRVLRMERTLLADRLDTQMHRRTARVEAPESPWQFFKQRHRASWWLGWLVRRRPVVMHHHILEVNFVVDRYYTFPEAKIYPQELGRPFIYEQVKTLDLT